MYWVSNGEWYLSVCNDRDASEHMSFKTDVLGRSKTSAQSCQWSISCIDLKKIIYRDIWRNSLVADLLMNITEQNFTLFMFSSWRHWQIEKGLIYLKYYSFHLLRLLVVFFPYENYAYNPFLFRFSWHGLSQRLPWTRWLCQRSMSLLPWL